MKLYTALISMLLALKSVVGSRYNVAANLCHPCAGATRVNRQAIVLNPEISSQHVCRQIHEFKIQVGNIRNETGRKLISLENGLFDGDMAHLQREHLDGEPRLCSVSSPGHSDTAQVSQLSSIYSRLVDLHQALSFTENHRPWSNRCSLSLSGLSNGVNQAMCSLYVIMRFSSQLSGFNNVCERQHCFRLHRGCTAFQDHSYIVLRHVRRVLLTVGQDIEDFELGHGCRS